MEDIAHNVFANMNPKRFLGINKEWRTYAKNKIINLILDEAI